MPLTAAEQTGNMGVVWTAGRRNTDARGADAPPGTIGAPETPGRHWPPNTRKYSLPFRALR